MHLQNFQGEGSETLPLKNFSRSNASKEKKKKNAVTGIFSPLIGVFEDFYP